MCSLNLVFMSVNASYNSTFVCILDSFVWHFLVFLKDLVYYLGLAKLHCGATPPSVMVLLAPQSGALRISAYRDFHPIPIPYPIPSYHL